MRLFTHILTILVLFIVLWTQSLDAQLSYESGDCKEFNYRIFQLGDTSVSGPSFLIRPEACPDPITILNDSTHWANHVVRSRQNSKSLPFGFGLRPLYVLWFNSYNTTVPRGSNDGPIWQGAGYNTAISGGVHLNNTWLHVRFNPMVGMAQNRSYIHWPESYIRNSNPYNIPFYRLDYVQRFGDKTYTWLDPGDSYIEARKYGLKLGFGTQRIWSGPALFNPLLFSYNSAGVPKAYLSTYKPIPSKIGSFEFIYLFGSQKESAYFDSNNTNNLTSIQTLFVVYSPSFIPGLSVGFNRVFIEAYPKSVRALFGLVRKNLEPFFKNSFSSLENSGDETPDEQLATIMGRWVFPTYGFEIYAEYGRDDHSVDFEDFLVQPDFARTYLFGFLKKFEINQNQTLIIGFENTVLDGTRNDFVKVAPGPVGSYNFYPPGLWYSHHRQLGFTHKGQFLGSGIGTGSNSRSLHATLLNGNYHSSIKFSQIHHHNSLLHWSSTRNIILANNEPGTDLWEMQPTEFMLGVSHTRPILWGLELSATIEQSLILNQYFIKKNDVWNTRFEMVVRMPLKGVLR